MTDYFFWWIACAVLVGAELITGTFYLAVLALAAAVGALAAHMGLNWQTQAMMASACALVGCFLVHKWRLSKQGEKNPLDTLDAGQTVSVVEWKSDGTARVAYRGSTWDAELSDASLPRAEIMAIVGTRGNTLIIGKPSV
jgi:membrane protein implicated in regulation of membrane protease activity